MPSGDSQPLIVMLHGLCGSSHELDLGPVLAPLLSRKARWYADAVICRGGGGGVYRGRLTWGFPQTVDWQQTTVHNRPLFEVGFLMGTSIVTRYMAEERFHGRICVV
jgi:predicted alpha/beta-fold hydrolase